MFLAALTSACAWYPQATHRKLGWLSRDSPATCPQALQVCDVYAAATFWRRPDALCSIRSASLPHAEARMARFSPAFCRTLRPGRWRVPVDERVIARTSKSSTQIRSNRRARSVLTFSTQSRRRSTSLALSLAMANLVRSRRRDPLRWRSLRRSSSRSRRRSADRNPGS
jgi:hypothetical protein